MSEIVFDSEVVVCGSRENSTTPIKDAIQADIEARRTADVYGRLEDFMIFCYRKALLGTTRQKPYEEEVLECVDQSRTVSDMAVLMRRLAEVSTSGMPASIIDFMRRLRVIEDVVDLNSSEHFVASAEEVKNDLWRSWTTCNDVLRRIDDQLVPFNKNAKEGDYATKMASEAEELLMSILAKFSDELIFRHDSSIARFNDFRKKARMALEMNDVEDEDTIIMSDPKICDCLGCTHEAYISIVPSRTSKRKTKHGKCVAYVGRDVYVVGILWAGSHAARVIRVKKNTNLWTTGRWKDATECTTYESGILEIMRDIFDNVAQGEVDKMFTGIPKQIVDAVVNISNPEIVLHHE